MARLSLSASFALLSVLGTSVGLGQSASENSAPSQSPAKTERKQPADTAKSGSASQSVALTLQVAGLGAGGCDIEIKPANPTCKFQTVKRHVDSSGLVEGIIIKNVEVRGADRNCSFAITVNEPGQKPRTIVRGFRMAKNTGGASQVQTFGCVLSAPSKLARLEDGGTTRKK